MLIGLHDKTAANGQNLRGFGSPYYGKLNSASLPSEVKRIWYSRHDEPPPPEPHGWSWEQVTEPDYESADLIRKILNATPLTKRETFAIYHHVVEGYTLDEIGKEFGCCRARVGQIIGKGLRRLRAYQKQVTGVYTAGDTE